MNAKNGIKILEDICTRSDLFYPTILEMLEEAKKELKMYGIEGSDALAELINDLAESRSSNTDYAIRAAEDLAPSTNLLKALKSVIFSKPFKEGNSVRFTPEIFGGGKIGWTDKTHNIIVEAAKKTFTNLTGSLPQNEILESVSAGEAKVDNRSVSNEIPVNNDTLRDRLKGRSLPADYNTKKRSKPHKLLYLILTVGLLLVFSIIYYTMSSKSIQPIKNQVTRRTELKLPAAFGVYLESADGLLNLFNNPTVKSKDLAFILYLENKPVIEKLRLRFKRTSNPSNIFNLRSNEDEGIYEANLGYVQEYKELLRANYRRTLEPDRYIAYYFTDESTGKQSWETARFQFAGEFTVENNKIK